MTTDRPGRTPADPLGQESAPAGIGRGSPRLHLMDECAVRADAHRGHRGSSERGAVNTIQRLAMISLHTSPLDQPGTGDAGGMNVYVIELARRLARQGIEVDIFTRATSSALEPVVRPHDGIVVRHIHAGPFEGLTKGELPG